MDLTLGYLSQWEIIIFSLRFEAPALKHLKLYDISFNSRSALVLELQRRFRFEQSDLSEYTDTSSWQRAVYFSIKRYCSNCLSAYINDLFTFFVPNLISFEISLDKYCVLCHSCTLPLRLCEFHCPIGYCVLLSRAHETYPLFQSPTVQCLLPRSRRSHIHVPHLLQISLTFNSSCVSYVLRANWGQSWALHPIS